MANELQQRIRNDNSKYNKTFTVKSHNLNKNNKKKSIQIRKSRKIIQTEKSTKRPGKSNIILFFLGIFALVVLFKLLYENQTLMYQIKELEDKENSGLRELENKERGKDNIAEETSVFRFRFLPYINEEAQVGQLDTFYKDQEQHDVEFNENNDPIQLNKIVYFKRISIELKLYDLAVEEFEAYNKQIKKELTDQVNKEIDPAKEHADELKSIQKELSIGLSTNNSSSISIPKFRVATSPLIDVDYHEYNNLSLDLVNKYIDFIYKNLTRYEIIRLQAYVGDVRYLIKISSNHLYLFFTH